MRRGIVGAALLAAGALSIAGANGWHLWHRAQLLQRAVHEAETGIQHHQLGRVETSLGRVAVDARLLTAALSPWTRVWGWVPGIGPSLVNTERLVAGTAAGAEAVRPLLLWASGLSPRAGVPTRAGQAFIAALPGLARAAEDLGAIDPRALPANVSTAVGPVLRLARRWRQTLALLARDGPALARSLGIAAPPKRWLVVYQDSGELRATGGFIAAVGTLRVAQGRIERLTIHPVGAWEQGLRWRPPAPWLLRYFFRARRWQFINANLSPDTPQVTRLLLRFYRSRPNAPPVAGVIYVDSRLVPRLLSLEGPVTLRDPATGHRLTFSAKRALVEMDRLALRRSVPRAGPEAFLAPLLRTLLVRAVDVVPTKRAQLAVVLARALAAKLVMVSAVSPKAEALLAHFDWAGTIDPKPRVNYLEVVDENLGGRKDNLFLQEVTRVAITGRPGAQTETVTLRLTLPIRPQGLLTGAYAAWLELWVPEGSRLLGFLGTGVSAMRVANAPRLGKSVLEGRFMVPAKVPGSSEPGRGWVRVRFRLPASIQARALTVQIQPGAGGPFRITAGPFHWQGNLESDRTFHW